MLAARSEACRARSSPTASAIAPNPESRRALPTSGLQLSLSVLLSFVIFATDVLIDVVYTPYLYSLCLVCSFLKRPNDLLDLRSLTESLLLPAVFERRLRIE